MEERIVFGAFYTDFFFYIYLLTHCVLFDFINAFLDECIIFGAFEH